MQLIPSWVNSLGFWATGMPQWGFWAWRCLICGVELWRIIQRRYALSPCCIPNHEKNGSLTAKVSSNADNITNVHPDLWPIKYTFPCFVLYLSKTTVVWEKWTRSLAFVYRIHVQFTPVLLQAGHNVHPSIRKYSRGTSLPVSPVNCIVHAYLCLVGIYNVRARNFMVFNNGANRSLHFSQTGTDSSSTPINAQDETKKTRTKQT